MEDESKAQSWEKIKQMIEERQDIQARIIYDNMDCLILQRELLDKLIEFKERSERVRSLSEPTRADLEGDLTLNQKLFYDKKCCQIHQELAFTNFVQNMFCSFMELLDGASKQLAWEVGEKSVNMIFEFLERYNDLLKQEYDWYQETIAENVPSKQ